MSAHQYASVHISKHQYTLVHISTHQYTAVRISAHQYTSVHQYISDHINTNQYTPVHQRTSAHKQSGISSNRANWICSQSGHAAARIVIARKYRLYNLSNRAICHHNPDCIKLPMCTKRCARLLQSGSTSNLAIWLVSQSALLFVSRLSGDIINLACLAINAIWSVWQMGQSGRLAHVAIKKDS